MASRRQAQTAPWILSEFLERHYTNTHRIEMNVIGDTRQGFATLDVQRLVTTLEWLTDFTAKAVESNRPRTLQPFHSEARVRLRSFQREAKMVPHDDECMQPPEKPI